MTLLAFIYWHILWHFEDMSFSLGFSLGSESTECVHSLDVFLFVLFINQVNVWQPLNQNTCQWTNTVSERFQVILIQERMTGLKIEMSCIARLGTVAQWGIGQHFIRSQHWDDSVESWEGSGIPNLCLAGLWVAVSSTGFLPESAQRPASGSARNAYC